MRQVGPQCERKSARTAAARSHVLLADAKRAQLGAIEQPDAGMQSAAQALALLPWMPVADRIAHVLALGLPWLLVIITEGAAIVAWSRALPAPRRSAGAAVQAMPTALAAVMPMRAQLPTPLPVSATVAIEQATIAAPPATVPTIGAVALVDVLRRHGQPTTVAEAAALMGVSRGEASRRWREAAGAINARRDGRRLMLTLA